MTPQKQLFMHDPENGVFGDCYRTVIACLLNVSPGEVPHFNQDTGAMDMEQQRGRINRFLAKRALREVSMALSGVMELRDVLACASVANPGLNWMLTGTSKTGCNHVVICRDGEIVWDPSLTDAGIVGPCDTGDWWIAFLGAAV